MPYNVSANATQGVGQKVHLVSLPSDAYTESTRIEDQLATVRLQVSHNRNWRHLTTSDGLDIMTSPRLEATRNPINMKWFRTKRETPEEVDAWVFQGRVAVGS